MLSFSAAFPCTALLSHTIPPEHVFTFFIYFSSSSLHPDCKTSSYQQFCQLDFSPPVSDFVGAMGNLLFSSLVCTLLLWGATYDLLQCRIWRVLVITLAQKSRCVFKSRLCTVVAGKSQRHQ